MLCSSDECFATVSEETILAVFCRSAFTFQSINSMDTQASSSLSWGRGGRGREDERGKGKGRMRGGRGGEDERGKMRGGEKGGGERRRGGKV